MNAGSYQTNSQAQQSLLKDIIPFSIILNARLNSSLLLLKTKMTECLLKPAVVRKIA